MSRIGQLSVRRLVALGFVGAALAIVLPFAAACWIFSRDTAAGGASVPADAVWAALAVAVVVVAVLWFAIDHQLLARLHDRRGLPALLGYSVMGMLSFPLEGEIARLIYQVGK